MTIACQSATTLVPITAPIGLTAQSMTITPSATPCYDPCSITVAVIWTNDTANPILAGTSISITVDNVSKPEWSTTTLADVAPAGTVTGTFIVTGLMHTANNIICPVPN